MKKRKLQVVVLALAGSFLLHVSFYGLQFLYGFVQTVLYMPNWSESWGNTTYVQNESTFIVGSMDLQFLLLISFLTTSVLCGICIWIYQKRKMI